MLGVKEENHKFSVVGVDDARKILTDFWNTVHGDKVSAVVVYEHDVRIEVVGGKQIVVVEVPRADRADNVTRDDDTPIHRSVREVVANALIHADYHGRQGIVIDKYPKRIEVSNPGILRISKAVAVAGGTSDARNAKIFNIFSLVKIGERSGMGLAQLYGNWEEAGYARPQLSESFNPERTKVEIEVEVAEKVAENSSQVAEKQGEVAEKVAENRREYTEKASEYTEKYTEKASEYTEKYTEKQTEKSGEYTENMAQSIANLTETEERIVAILRQNKFATQGGISAQLGITRTYITKIMGGLQSRNIIRRIGPDKGGYWEVLPQ